MHLKIYSIKYVEWEEGINICITDNCWRTVFGLDCTVRLNWVRDSLYELILHAKDCNTERGWQKAKILPYWRSYQWTLYVSKVDKQHTDLPHVFWTYQAGFRGIFWMTWWRLCWVVPAADRSLRASAVEETRDYLKARIYAVTIQYIMKVCKR